MILVQYFELPLALAKGFFVEFIGFNDYDYKTIES